MKYYIIAGEASGDLHGSNLMKGLNQVDPNPEYRIWGGELMQTQGGKLVKHYKDLAVMGFVEVLLNAKTIKKNMAFCKQDMLRYKPDVLILIDYPGFNLRMAEFAHLNGIKVFYYISPKVWAWKKSRVKKIKQFVDKMFVIFPFEPDWYKQYNYDVIFEGNPLLDAVNEELQHKSSFNDFIQENYLENKPIIALVPGSRKQEIAKKLPVMLKAASKFTDYQLVITGAPSMEREFYAKFTKNYEAKLIFGKTYDILSHSTAALVTSGTATLETALFQIPQVVCYIGNSISVAIARMLVKIKFISLVNLIVDKEIVRELIQNDCNENTITEELNQILPQGKKREQMLADYKALKYKLGGAGASVRFARHMYQILQHEN